jgi:hypothetical protein
VQLADFDELVGEEQEGVFWGDFAYKLESQDDIHLKSVVTKQARTEETGNGH